MMDGKTYKQMKTLDALTAVTFCVCAKKDPVRNTFHDGGRSLEVVLCVDCDHLISAEVS